jgi:DNA-binding response OmpR family regulator
MISHNIIRNCGLPQHHRELAGRASQNKQAVKKGLYMRVLLVDDEVEFVTALSDRLRMRSIEVEVAYDGLQALRHVENHETDVVVLDLKMPGLDGMEVLSRLRRAYSDIQVVILAGHGAEHQEKQTRRLNVYGCLTKPTDIETLVDKIRGAYMYKRGGR